MTNGILKFADDLGNRMRMVLPACVTTTQRFLAVLFEMVGRDATVGEKPIDSVDEIVVAAHKSHTVVTPTVLPGDFHGRHGRGRFDRKGRSMDLRPAAAFSLFRG